MAQRGKASTIFLTFGVSLVIAGLGAYFLLQPGDAYPPPDKSELFPFQDAETGLWGYLGPDAAIVIPARFEHADLFHGLGLVEYEGMAGYIDRAGRWAIAPRFVLDPEYPSDVAARPFWGDLAAARQGSTWGFIDREGRWAIPPRFEGADGFELIGDFHEGRAWFRRDNRYGFIDTTGDVVIEPIYDAAGDFGEGLAGVLVGEEWGAIDAEGRLRITPDYEGLGTFSQGLCAARRDGRWGYIDRRGTWVIEPQYTAALPFQEGLAPVQTGLTWGYIDPSGEYRIPPQYEAAWPFENGMAAVTLDGRPGYINPDARLLWPRSGAGAIGAPATPSAEGVR